MEMKMEIETIMDSWIIGNKKHAREQVKKYGLKRFIVDVLEQGFILRNESINNVIIYMLKH
jgi:hypothetical protein